MQLYTYYRSQASFRVRIALNLKGLSHDDVFLHLEKGDQFAPEYRALNPQMVVPTLLDGEAKLFQSLAILEYLEEKYPEPPLLPDDIAARAWVRGLALINIADSHPLVVPRIRHYFIDQLQLSQEQLLAWIRHWLGAGLAAMEALLAEHRKSGRFCHGDRPTIADIGVVTQVTPAKTFGVNLAPYPRVVRIYDRLHGDPGLCRRPSGKAARRGVGGIGRPAAGAAMARDCAGGGAADPLADGVGGRLSRRGSGARREQVRPDAQLSLPLAAGRRQPRGLPPGAPRDG